MACTGAAASRVAQAGAKYGNGEFIQVHPTAIPGADKLRLMSESARGEGGRVWVPRTPHDPRDPKAIPEAERYYFLEERYPKYGNLVPRDIATREIFDVCVNEGLSVDATQQSVYLDLTHIPRAELDRKLGGILSIYEKFQGVDPRDVPMKIFPAVHYSMGGLWADYERTAAGGLVPASPRNQQTNIPGLYAIGECDYQYHGANRLGANSLLSCIFTGLIVAPGIEKMIKSLKASASDAQFDQLIRGQRAVKQLEHDSLLKNNSGGRENPYVIHQQLGAVMTKAATVVRQNDQLRDAIEKVNELGERVKKCSPILAVGPIRTSCLPSRCATCSRSPKQSSSAHLPAMSRAAPTSSRSSRCPASTPRPRLRKRSGWPMSGATSSNRRTNGSSNRRSARSTPRARRR
jgi:succinate dehydrogenase / fumarate reductase flavoprotein subunit